MADGHPEETIAAQLSEALHNMCQPLTALQCRLEIGQLRDASGEPVAAAIAWAECLRECSRLNATVHAMRSLIQKAAIEMQERETKG